MKSYNESDSENEMKSYKGNDNENDSNGNN